MDKVFGRFFARFNRLFQQGRRRATQRGVTRTVKRAPIAIAVYAGLIALTVFGFMRTPGGLHSAAGQAVPGRRRAVAARGLARSHRPKSCAAWARSPSSEPGVLDSVQFAGVSANGFAAQSSAALVFFPLKDFDERKGLTAGAIAGALNQKFAVHPGRLHRGVPAAAGDRPRHAGRLQAQRARTGRTAAPKRCTPPCRTRSAEGLGRIRRSPACSPATRSTCRSSTSTWIASRSSARA